MNTTPTKPDYDHLQITLRLPNWVVAQVDGIAAAQFTNRASVLRRLLAGAVGFKSTAPGVIPERAETNI